MRIALISLVIPFLLMLQSCEPEQNTVYVPEPTCDDGILNQNELEIDCGGPCKACPSRMTAKVDGMAWQALGNVTSSTNSGSIIIMAGNSTSTMSMIYTGSFTTGTFNLASAVYQVTATQTSYVANGGTITFSQWDNNHKVVSGTFAYTAVETSGTGDQKVITEGTFKYVPFQ
jgi:hypothetical protein